MLKLSRQPNWVTAQAGDELVMMSTENDLYIGLTAIGARIWELIETPIDVDTLCARLIEEYDVDAATCRADVDRFVAELVHHGAAAVGQA
jgi:hypothetical protein